MHFLVTNDDGVFADGLAALVNELKKIAEITVVAPDRERSAVGHALTFFNPLRVQTIKQDKKVIVYSSDGTPSDCILLGIYDLMPRKPDLVISGINRGANMGDDVTYSGTVSAAMEGIIHGVPSFAISLAAFSEVYYDYAASFARKLAKSIVKYGLPPRTFLNVNVPNVPDEKIQGLEITKQGESIYDQRLIKRMDPRGIEYYWITGALPTGEAEEGTDFKAVYENKVSITPIQLNMTNHDLIEEIKKWEIL